jgi:hypothetical protein
MTVAMQQIGLQFVCHVQEYTSFKVTVCFCFKRLHINIMKEVTTDILELNITLRPRRV